MNNGQWAIFKALLKSSKLPFPVPEYKFHDARKWRADYAWPEQKVILEVEGGVWSSGRHTRGSGFIKDMEKYNTAVLLGYRIIRVVPDELCTMKTIKMLKILLNPSEGCNFFEESSV